MNGRIRSLLALILFFVFFASALPTQAQALSISWKTGYPFHARRHA